MFELQCRSRHAARPAANAHLLPHAGPLTEPVFPMMPHGGHRSPGSGFTLAFKAHLQRPQMGTDRKAKPTSFLCSGLVLALSDIPATAVCYYCETRAHTKLPWLGLNV